MELPRAIEDGPTGRWLVVIGAGRWGLNHVRTCEEMGILGAVVDPNCASRDAARKLTTATVVATLAELLEKEGADAVLTGAVVATPAPSHYAVARDALSAGLDVLVEKPMCDSVDNAKRLAAFARVRGRVLLVGHLLLYGAPHRRLLALVRAGRVGRVTRVHARRLNFGTVRVAEDALWSLSPHDVSVVLALCCNSEDSVVSQAASDAAMSQQDQQVRVTCHGQCVVPGNEGIHDYVDLRLEFAGNVTANIEANWLHPVKERGLTVYGTEGCVMLNEAGCAGIPVGGLRFFRWNVKKVSDNAVAMREWEEEECAAEVDDTGGDEARPDTPLRRELEHFAACCRERESLVPLTGGTHGVRVTQVLAAGSRSMANGGAWQDVVLQASGCSEELLDAEPVTNPSSVPSSYVVGLDRGCSPNYFAHESAIVDEGARIGEGTKIWHFSHVMRGAVIGRHCSFGQNVYVGGGAVIGDRVRVQNNVSIFDGVELLDDVFVGPSVVFTNVRTPRADAPRGREGYARTLVGLGATVGANATVVCGVCIGSRSLVGAGAVVTRDVAPHALVTGNPARHAGWVGTLGAPLVRSAGGSDGRGGLFGGGPSAANPVLISEDSRWVCPESGEAFVVRKGVLVRDDGV
jgi:UDP-2-acetamido-3-amino-2,3-dideoxy-glucuronate N-acetyltransferase